MSNNNILLVSDDEAAQKLILEKLVLLRENDKISCCSFKDLKKNIENFPYCVAIIHCAENKKTILKTVKHLKDSASNLQIILFTENVDSQYILSAYDEGIYDYITPQTENWKILIKVINCFKQHSLLLESTRNKKFLNIFGLIDPKTGLYKYNYLKDIFYEINDDTRVQNGFMCALTIDDKVKTKISLNRLAGVLKNTLRADDISAIARGGLFYIIVPNLDFDGMKGILQKIQNKMGQDFELRAGLCKIGIQSFETIEKNANDSLLSAIQNNKMCVSLTDNTGEEQAWLSDDGERAPQKHYKIFQQAFESKLNNIITPQFFKFQRECEIKLPGTTVSQYANKVESVFSLKNDNLHSELIIHYDGFAKFKIEIVHSGLDTAENSKYEIPLNKLTEKELLKYLKQLRSEYKQGKC